jgi:hypothetical protein
VIATPLCIPIRSKASAKNEIVTSPSDPFGLNAGMGNRRTALGFLGSHLSKAWTWSGSKYFQLFMRFAAAGAARKIVLI